jgi:hypothetical protein
MHFIIFRLTLCQYMIALSYQCFSLSKKQIRIQNAQIQELSLHP